RVASLIWRWAATAATSGPRSRPGSATSKPDRPCAGRAATCLPRRVELVNAEMPAREKAKWGRVWRYAGARGVVWRIRYRDASGRRILETLGKEPAWDRNRAERELRRRLVDVERDGYRKPDKLTFAVFAARWQAEYLPGRGLKQT